MKRFLHPLVVSTVAVVSLGSLLTWAANYNVTEGSGKTFGSITVAAVDYAQQLLCDSVAPSRCVTVSASGQASINATSGAIASGAVASGAYASGSIASGAIASGAVAAGAYSAGSIISGTASDGWDSTQGSTAQTACATDTGTCTVIQLVKRQNQIISTLNSTALSSVPAGTNYIGQFGLNAATTGGWTPTFLAVANSISATSLKGSAGIVHAVQGFGISGTPMYLKLYDKATAPTCGTDVPVKVIMIPGISPVATAGAGAVSNIMDAQFSVGIGYCLVTGIANSDATSPTASTFIINIDWK